MKIIKRARQTGRTSELIKYCIENHESGKANLPYLLIVSSFSEKRIIENKWAGAIHACFFVVKTFAECIQEPYIIANRNWSGVVIDNVDICLNCYFGKVDLVTTL